MPRRAAKDVQQLVARRSRSVRNRRLPEKARAQRLASRMAVPDERRPFLIRITSLYAVIGWMFLLPACLITTLTLRDGFGASMSSDFWRSPSFWFFGLGLVMWLIWFFFLPRPVRWYVFAHEMTHAIFVILCGGRVQEFQVTDKGGHVVTDRNNVLISLSPYFVPLYTIVIVVLFLLAGAMVDLTSMIELPWGGGFRLIWGLFWLIGLTWAFHATFTVWMIWKDQPDLRSNGVFFSLTLIYLTNGLLLSALLVAASPDLTFRGFATTWMNHAIHLTNLTGKGIQSAFDLIGG